MSAREEWRAVPGGDGVYEVSSLGRVRSVDRIKHQRFRDGVVRGRRLKGRVLRPYTLPAGYKTVVVFGKSRLVHNLVLEAFVGPRPGNGSFEYHGMHKDGSRDNNRLSNLRWGTVAENHADTVRHGTIVRGERSVHARLTEADVRAIRTSKERNIDLAAHYGVNPNHIYHIRKGTAWTHV